MKKCILRCAIAALLFLGGCAFSPTKVRVRVIEHTLDRSGNYYALVYQILEPKKLAGKYGLAATDQMSLAPSVDGTEYYIYLNFTMIGLLSDRRPTSGYLVSRGSGRGDFLVMGKRVK